MRDLLQDALGIRFESFTRGRDDGIDLRALRTPDGLLIAQAKHFAGSRISNLLSSIKKEKLKLDKLDQPPDRYIIATSLGLTPGNKTAIFNALQPYITSESDIYGPGDIEGLLSANPQIENRHFKLWLANGDRLAAVSNATVLNRSGITKADLLTRAKLFVPHPVLDTARQMLAKNHLCIISGQAGVGKTTLAKMLILQYLVDGFEFYDISSDITEAERSVSPASRQIFLYDDFLGRTNLSPAMSKNEDSRLLQFMQHIRSTENKRMILTTREYIFAASQRKFDRLEDPTFEAAKLIVRVTGYSRLDRARMLYNHLYFDESIHQAELEDLVNERKYFRIVDHRNFNPRMIEMALKLRLKSSQSGSL